MTLRLPGILVLLGLFLGDGLPARSADNGFRCGFEPSTGWLTSLRRDGDPQGIEFIRPGQVLGGLRLRTRLPGQPWEESNHGGPGLSVASRFRPDNDALLWEIELRNTNASPREIGDLALPLPMHTDYVWDHAETFQRRVFRHAFIAGHGSFLYWLPVQGGGPILVLQPVGDAHLEFFTAEGMDYAHGGERFSAFVHSLASAELETRGSWRQPRTSRLLRPGESAVVRFAFRWASSHDEVRALLHRHGGVDVHVLPGTVVPRDLDARLAFRAGSDIRSLEPEFPSDTEIGPLPLSDPAARGFRVRFRRLGENRLTLRHHDGRSLPLEFFVTEPLETLIRKRASFIVRQQQHRRPDLWYDGLFSLWDRRQPADRNLLGPDHLAGQHPYAVSGSDDPSNGKCLLVAEKNAAYPDPAEVRALEYFVDHFVWGRHQRTDRETPYPFGIYGSDSWKQNRFADRDPLDQGVSRPGGPSACRMWRSFDYTTYFALYLDLFRIARQRPELFARLTASDCLDRAFGTARAYFEVPAHIRMEGGWSHTGRVQWQYTVGNFHEKYLLPLIEALEAAGRRDQADFLRGEWEKKVKFFIYDHPWPFASEMPIDSTAYESTYAAARYALEHGLQPDTRLWQDLNSGTWYSHPRIDPDRHRQFLQRQLRANLACRGVLEPHYWSLGSDFRGCGAASYTLSYMTPMGGWAILDQALRFDDDPVPGLRLGYASLLAPWALLNAGDAASNHGFWTPGPRHDGAMSWGFQPRQVGTEWNPATRDLPRGAWPVCGEADHGLVAAIETASTILYHDPLFGPSALGGEIVALSPDLAVVPRDGVRQRFHALLGGRRLHLALDRDGFREGRPVRFAPDGRSFEFEVENRSPNAHEAVLTVEGLPPGTHTASTADTSRALEVRDRVPARIRLPVPATGSLRVRVNPGPPPTTATPSP